METKDTLSSCSDLDEQEIQQLQKQAKILKENSLNKFNAFKTTTQRLKRQTFSNCPLFQRAFSHFFHTDFDKFIHSEMLESSNYDSNAREARQDFKDYTQMEAQSLKDLIIQHMKSIKQCIVERARHEQEIQNRLKRLSERKLQILECKVQKVKATDASSGDTNCSGIVSDKGNDQGLENQSNTSRDESNRSRNECNDKSTSGDDTDIRPSYDTEPIVEMDQNAVECDDERVALANLIANLKLDVDENKKIQKQLKKANTSLAHELKECKSILAETSRTLGESNSIRDSCLIALQNKQTELETYKTLNDRTVDYDKLEHKLNETLGLLAQKEIDIKEGLKLKAYEISVVKEKHDELVKQSLLTKSHYEGLVKEKTKVITDLKLKEEKDIDKMISMEKQLKFLNEIVYKRNQSIQTIHMLAPKGPTFNGRPTFANPMYLKKAQSEKPCLYEIPYDQSDPANRLVPDREETLTLEKESRSKLNKDLVRPYDYTKLNSLYEIFKPASQEYHEQLAHANEVFCKMRSRLRKMARWTIESALSDVAKKWKKEPFKLLRKEVGASLRHDNVTDSDACYFPMAGPFASAFPGPMTHLVASPTLASENSGVMHGASCAQRKISMVLFSIPFVLSWGNLLRFGHECRSVTQVVIKPLDYHNRCGVIGLRAFRLVECNHVLLICIVACYDLEAALSIQDVWMFACHDVSMKCLYFNVRHLLDFVETSRTLGEYYRIRDSCLIAHQNKQTELETYKTLNDRTVDYDKLEHKLNETLGLLAQKEIYIKEGLKLKAYEISVIKEK
ncbi:hypothetical protein Tco_0709614 [Tanacetum coccineum]